VDDEANARSALAELLHDLGYSVETAADGFKALPKLAESLPDVVLTDLKMPGLDGMGLLQSVLSRDPECAVIVMTAFGAVDSAVAAMRAGATNYLTKPIHFDELARVVAHAVERRRLRKEVGQLRKRLSEKSRIPKIIGASPQIQAVFDTVLQVAPSRASGLITGESGTGKDLTAAAIHEHSTRAGGPFVKLHCAALAESLLETELFGYERGGMVGADSRRDGRIQQADRGTLFLDEIGEISLSLQARLLRFLQEHEFERIGGTQTLKADVRVIAATHCDLRARVKQGLFRDDLYYRLNVLAIELPPLRQRLSDIGLLAQFFLDRYAKENSRSVHSISAEALERMRQYRWPGNIRELENVMERAVVVCRGEAIRAEDLALTARPDGTPVHPELPVGRPTNYPPIPGSTLAELEAFAILETLHYTGGSTSRAAEMLDISPRKIQYKLQEYLHRPPRKRVVNEPKPD
jgi:DNA-binding NtrC family response regulator